MCFIIFCRYIFDWCWKSHIVTVLCSPAFVLLVVFNEDFRVNNHQLPVAMRRVQGDMTLMVRRGCGGHVLFSFTANLYMEFNYPLRECRVVPCIHLGRTMHLLLLEPFPKLGEEATYPLRPSPVDWLVQGLFILVVCVLGSLSGLLCYFYSWEPDSLYLSCLYYESLTLLFIFCPLFHA